MATPRDRWLFVRPLILNDTSKVFEEEPVWITRGKRLELQARVFHSMPLAVDLDVVGQATIYGDFSITLRANVTVQVIRLCRYADHKTTGWHSLWVPNDAKPIHENAPDLAGISREDAFQVFCHRVSIEMPEQMRLELPEGS